MADMLVKLYDLNYDEKVFTDLKDSKLIVRRAKAPEKFIVLNWIKKEFGEHWASECDVSFSNNPISCFIAVDEDKNQIIGFSCFDATCKDFFGPMGVDKTYRGKDIGKALLLIALKSMEESGYAYAIIGGVGPAKFYEKVANATLIENSEPGIYKGLLKS